MHPMLSIAVRAARAAGNVLLRYLDRLHTIDVALKSHNELVSEVDREAERVIIDIIHKAHPGHGILGEETGLSKGDGHLWIIDPLDGTTNYLHGFPQFSVSIAVQYKDRLEQAVVYDPLREELFTATRGAGAQLNNRRIRVSKCTHLRHALLGTGYPYRDLSELDSYLAIFRDLITKTTGIRRAGSAALDLAYVAAGRLDGFWEFGLKPWDMAAGALLIREAGGIVGDLNGGEGFLDSGGIAAGNPKVFEAILQSVRAPAKTKPANRTGT